MTPEPHGIGNEPPATAAEWLEAGEAEPVPYTLTPRAEAVLASWDRFRAIGEAERLALGEPEPEAEAEPEWDSEDSNATRPVLRRDWSRRPRPRCWPREPRSGLKNSGNSMSTPNGSQGYDRASPNSR